MDLRDDSPKECCQNNYNITEGLLKVTIQMHCILNMFFFIYFMR